MKDNKTTVVIGASANPARYSNLAVKKLKSYGHEVVPIGIREGTIDNIPIVIGRPEIKNVDTVTLYLNASRQKEYYDYIFKLRPKRIIFNPGAENPEFERLSEEKGIEPLEACTLVMLSTGQY
ncbi:MAG TPA: CoA-binding protein [Chitinophagales bacterium]|nr:CoA-binding protein [Chitinophagales bacterium]